VAKLLTRFEEVLRNHLGLGFWPALLVLGSLVAAGVSAGLLFPKFEATGMLQFPEAQKPHDPKERPGEQRFVDPKANVICQPTNSRCLVRSADQLRMVESVGLPKALPRPTAASGSAWLLGEGSGAGTAFQQARPEGVRRHQDASATAMLGLSSAAANRATAQDMVMVRPPYTNAVLRGGCAHGSLPARWMRCRS
jgi:hypothetical protein